MNQPALAAWCSDDQCDAYGARDAIPAVFDELGRRVVLIEEDERCPECGAVRRFEG